MYKVLVVWFLFVLVSCDEAMLNEMVYGSDETQTSNIYLIKAGNHDIDGHRSIARKRIDTLRFSFSFDSTAIYRTKSPQNQGDINKLYGLSDCEDHHHTNSARFGWRWTGENLEVLAYCYLNGERKWALIDVVELNDLNNAAIFFSDQQYIFKLNDTTLSMPRSCSARAIGYQLYPYFGGDETAPQDIRIFIEDDTE